jgi:hypothetical protein
MTLEVPAAPRTVTFGCPHCGSKIDVDATCAGTMVNCPAPGCGKPFQVEVPAAEPVRSTSPIVLPPGVTLAPAPAVPAEATQAAIAAATQAAQPPERPETPGETIHLSLVRRYPVRFLCYVLLIGAGVAVAVYGEMREWHLLTLVGAAAALGVLLRLSAWCLRTRLTTLTLSNKRGVLATGVFRRDRIEFEFLQIADFHVSQSMLMRWLNVGDLAIVTSSGRQIVLMAVPDPHAVGAHLRTHSDAEKKASEKPDLVVVQQPLATA